VGLYFHSPNTPSWHGTQLKAEGQLYLYLYFAFVLSSLSLKNTYSEILLIIRYVENTVEGGVSVFLFVCILWNCK